jgi:tRNA(fMet)-specific endonuclease VapC
MWESALFYSGPLFPGPHLLEPGVLQALRRNRQALEEEIADFNEGAALVYGTVRADLEYAGRPIGLLDTQIGAHALSLNSVLVTNNVAEFRRIKGLDAENWLD